MEVGGCQGTGWTTYLQRREVDWCLLWYQQHCTPRCACVCWGPEQWLFLPELRIRKQLCLPSWDPWGLDLGGGPPPPDAAA